MNAVCRPVRPAVAGFTLIEVLIAMGIFTVGAIAIAAPMLVAARIQGQTVDSILVKQGERNAEALLLARPAFYDPPAAPSGGPRPVFNDESDAPVADMTVHAFSKTMLAKWSLADRIIGGSNVAYSVNPEGRDGRYLWVPLIRSTRRVSNQAGDALVLDATQWQIYVFLMRIDREANYGSKLGSHWANRGDPDWVPGVRTMEVTVDAGNWRKLHIGGGVSNDANGDGRPDLLRPGDKILDKYGRDYSVIETVGAGAFKVDVPVSAEAAADAALVIWYAEPEHAAAPSPIRSIRLLQGAVK